MTRDRNGASFCRVTTAAARTRAWLDALWRDTRYTLRIFRRSPGFAATAVVSLAVGIAAATAMFSIVNAALLHPFPFDRRFWERTKLDGFRVIALDARGYGESALPSSELSIDELADDAIALLDHLGVPMAAAPRSKKI